MSREDNRQRMPVVAAVVDQFREFLGSVVYASENGHTLDRREPVSADQVFEIPAGYCKPFEMKGKK
jgi:hypothetical protein